MIQVAELKKSYQSNVAVDGVSFSVAKREVFGLLGPNGAGKSTTIAMMAGLMRPDLGSVSVAGLNPLSPGAKKRIGLAPQALALYERLTAEENVAFFAKLFGLSGHRLKERTDWALELAGLQERRKDTVQTFSGGMKRRLNLACALVHSPELVFLDEPTAGVDPQSRNYLFDSVERLRGEGLTVVYTTHYMEEAQRLCDRVAIMDHGKILALDTVPKLIEEHGGDSVIVAEFDKVPESLAALGGEISDSTFKLKSANPFRDVARIADCGTTMSSLHIDRPDLESVFLSLTGRSLRD